MKVSLRQWLVFNSKNIARVWASELFIPFLLAESVGRRSIKAKCGEVTSDEWPHQDVFFSRSPHKGFRKFDFYRDFMGWIFKGGMRTFLKLTLIQFLREPRSSSSSCIIGQEVRETSSRRWISVFEVNKRSGKVWGLFYEGWSDLSFNSSVIKKQRLQSLFDLVICASPFVQLRSSSLCLRMYHKL